VKKIGDEYFTFVTECKDPKACTILLRGASKEILAVSYSTSTALVTPPLLWLHLHCSGYTSTALVTPPLLWLHLHCSSYTSTALVTPPLL